jgi:putative exosortase-associated protein (TIGR04073 family)
MRKTTLYLSTVVVAAILASGCAGPEKKLGRGLRNTMEVARMGEMRRSIEQTALWEGRERAYTTGVVRGFNRTVARTALGVWETATFMLPTTPEGDYEAPFTPQGPLYPDPSIATLNNNGYGGMVLPEDPVYPDVHKDIKKASSVLEADTNIGFDGGDIAPGFFGSRFRVFE